MRLYLQFGFGMMGHCEQLIGSWGGGTVILSPRDLEAEQLLTFSAKITGMPKGRVLFDPQFYVPHSDHVRLCSHDYWPADYQTGGFWTGTGVTQLIKDVVTCNVDYGCKEVILPGLMADRVDDDWIAAQQAVLDAWNSHDSTLPALATIALSASATADSEQIATLLEAAEDWNPEGYYLVCEHPTQEYLVTTQDWLNNVIGLAANLKLRGAKVVVGYCNHQMLIAAAAKVHAISSGTWLNVRAFTPDKFNTTDDIKRKSIWYYCPQALSEYKIPALDIAFNANILRRMQPTAPLDGGYAAALFSGAQPSSVGWSEQNAFRHYLHALRVQSRQAEQNTFDDTVASHRRLLDTAENLLDVLSSRGIDGEVRDFRNVLGVNRAALDSLIATQGPLLRRRWPNL